MALLAAFPFIGAAWHHYRWSDMDADDLAMDRHRNSRPAWVRGIVSEARGLRHQRPGFGFGGGDQEKVTTRFVLDITSITDGRTLAQSLRASGRRRHGRSVFNPGGPGGRGGGANHHARPTAQSR